MQPIGILIPTYKPEPTLIGLVHDLRRELPGAKFFLVLDGMEAPCDFLFKEFEHSSDVVLVPHAVNLGKGRALKSGINEILAKHPEIQIVVTADADGQHLPADIASVARATKNQVVLGSRFSGDQVVPLRSKFGNTLTSLVFRFFIGLKLRDTQTGLRGFPRAFLPELLKISGERYEYETNALILAQQKQWRVEEVPIQTVYINQNRGSHFNPIKDSMQIYFLIFRFCFSSAITSIIDFIVFTSVISNGHPLWLAFTAARLVAGTFNFTVNKRIVFKSGGAWVLMALRYWSLVVVLGFFSFLFTRYLVGVGMNVYFSKVLVEGILFVLSFIAQRDIVFFQKEKA